jgi:hypothetical protein
MSANKVFQLMIGKHLVDQYGLTATIATEIVIFEDRTICRIMNNHWKEKVNQ